MLRRRLASVPLVLLFAAGCAGNGPEPTVTTASAHVSGPEATTDAFGNSRVTVRATEAGVSDRFTVTSGLYHLTYLIDAGTDGCTFALILNPSKDGPVVQSIRAILADAAEGAGEDSWTLKAGQYLLQEDETGLLNCARGFSATITAQN